MGNIVTVAGLDNREFLDRYARPGRIGLTGGVTFVDRVIRRAERHLDAEGEWSRWSHAMIFQGKRADGRHWILESDMQVRKGHVSLGVQENRIDKYHDERLYPWLAVLDFGLTEAQVEALLGGGLDLVAAKTRYSLRELVGTWITLRSPGLRGKGNPLDRDGSLYCSALVRHLYRSVGVDLAPGVHEKNTSPEDLIRAPLPHDGFLLTPEVKERRRGGRRPRP